MKVKLEYYRIFHEVVKQKSFSKASEYLFMTQSAVSQAIAQLESILEIQLFFRESRGVRLTPEGEVLESYAKHAIASFEKAEKELDNMKNLKQGALRIGVGDMVARHFLLKYLEKFTLQYPDITIQLLNRTTTEIFTLLKNHEIDIAFVNLYQYEKGIMVKKAWDVHDIFIASEEYGQFQKQTFCLKDLKEYPIILLDPSTTRTNIDLYYDQEKIKLNPSIEVGSNDLILNMVAMDLGIGIVTKEFSSDFMEKHDLFQIDVQPPIPARTVGICINKYTEASKSAKAFLGILEEDIE